MIIETIGEAIPLKTWYDDELYTYKTNSYEDEREQRPLTFIPYFTWVNCGEGEMLVWFKES